ncbi:CxC2 domain-containing protein [Mycena sanguinolenta]|uniref:CxC2 domain-containing protein n=1 Tax=Mycena sanguinolenta TaxID=230812 RepID=A0A8H7CW39_9AGAR|nr:CxC2 domain-containing protein [Mycena sanguinolenta]
MSHKRKGNKPQLVAAATVTSVSHTTHDQRRVRTKTTVVGDAGPSSTQGTDLWAEDLATNLARNSASFSYQLGDNSLEPQLDDGVDDGITVVVEKSRRNTNSDRPLKNWYPKNDEYVEESLRREGRGLPKTYSRCAGSRGVGGECLGDAEWRCVDQLCFGELMYCSSCIVSKHVHHPTHFVERWTGTHFLRKRNWLQLLGLRVQLGHPPGVICPYRQPAAHDFVLYDLTGVHELNVDFCGCRTGLNNEDPPIERRIHFAVLRLFHKLNCLGKVSAYDFLRGLEMTTNHDGLDKPPDRRRPFMHIMRQWREVKRQKRAKRGHYAEGTRGTKQGELVIPCRACPQPGWNLPDGWEDADPAYKFIYFLFLAMDANFRLSNRSVSSEAADPIMGDGLGYFCKRHGEDGYNAHVSKYANETELSNCSGFQAMSQANTRRTKGLRSTGIAGVTCSRHNMWRANGIGDLQVGERQSNMDFVLLACLIGFRLLWLIISYDIACQYAINFWLRMSNVPEHMKLTIAPTNVWWKVPNFHLPDHKRKCHSPYSFHWMPGAGKSHGEGIEQNWAFSNGAAGSTRLMGPGSRHATLEDIFGFHNYDRLLAMRGLMTRLSGRWRSRKERPTPAAFDAFTKGLKKVRPDQVEEWRGMVDTWEATQHTTPEGSPFELKDEVTTLRDIQLQIATEEFVCAGDGIEVERDHSPGTFITMGLDIEEAQRKLTVDVSAIKDPSATQKLDFTRRRTALLRRIHKFREIQRVYMPSVRGALSVSQKQMFDGNGEQLPEATRLFMPSELPDAPIRTRVCALGLPEIEARMREAESTEALEAVRTGLRTRTMTNRYKLRNYTGQGLMTKGQGILRQINVRIHIAKLRYRYSRAALLVLRGHGAWEGRLRVLADDDVRGLNERALTDEEKAQNEHWAEIGGAIIEGGVARAAGVAAGEGNHTLSWIWYSVGVVEGENDIRLEDALRVEWCKALARSRRYTEEVRLLREEMRRTIAYGAVAAADWERLAGESLAGASEELTEGRCAYAAEHALTERARCADLEKRWRPILDRADAYLAGNTDIAAVTVEVDVTDELDPEEEEARLEGDAGEDDGA